MAVENEDMGDALQTYVSILDASPLPMDVLDRSGRIRLWNPAAERLLGWTAAEVIGKPPPGIPEDERATSELQLQQALHGKTITGVEGRRRTRAGDILDVRLATAPVADTKGRIFGVVQTFEDVSQRKRVEEALRQSEERYRTIVTTANEGIWLIDLQARTVYANERMAQMLGYSTEELSKRSVLDCIDPGDEPTHRERIGHNMRGQAEQFDTRFLRKDGSEVLVLGCTSPVRDAEGTVVGALGMFTDITERVRAEEERLELLAREQQARAEAEEAQRRLSLLADASALLASSLDFETTLRSLADAVVPGLADWCAVHLVEEDGTVRQIAVAHPDPDMVELARQLERRYPYDPEAPAGVPQVLRSGRPELVSEVSDDLLQTLSPDAELRQAVRELGLTSWMVVPLSARERLLGALTLATAQSGRRYGPDDVALAEVLARRAALAVDNARLYSEAQRVAAEQSAMLSHMADGVVMVDQEGRVTFRNEAARRLTGGEPPGSLESALTRYEIMSVDGRPYALDQLPLARALARQETVADARWRVRHPDGTEIVLQGSATPVVAGSGELLGAVSTFREVTAQVTLEQQKEEFLSAVAHDLKTPLTSLKGMAQMLRRRLARDGGASPEQLREGLARIEQNASRMASLIGELLDLSHLQMGKGLELNRRPTDLVSLVAQCVAEQEEVTGTRRITLQSLTPELTGTWDADRL